MILYERLKKMVPGISIFMVAAILLQISGVFLILTLLSACGIYYGIYRLRVMTESKESEFTDISLYMEQLLYSFQKHSKILNALMDVESLFSEGRMKKTITASVRYMKTTFGDEELGKNALQIVEAEYDEPRISRIHRQLLNVELLGGTFSHGIRILLSDCAVYEKEKRLYLQEGRKKLQIVRIAVGLSAGLCMMTPFIASRFFTGFQLKTSLAYQLASMVFLILEGSILLLAEKRMLDCYEKKKQMPQEILLKQYWKVVRFNVEKERKKSLCLAAIPMTAVVISLIVKNNLTLILGLVTTGFLLQQHQTGYKMASRQVRKEIRKSFPDWLLELSLLLQSENVPVAVKKSQDHMDALLLPSVTKLWQQMDEFPESNRPFCEFLNEFHIPEVKSAMGMLYSLTIGGDQENQQIENLLSRNAELLQQAEKLKNEDRLAALYLLFLMPSLAGMLKLIFDMSIILISYFESLRILGR